MICLIFPVREIPKEKFLVFRLYIFSRRILCADSVAGKLRLNVTEKSGVHQVCLVLCAYLVDILWFAVDQFRISVFYFWCCRSYCTWRYGVTERTTCWSVMDIIVDCGMILLFCRGYGGERLAAMLIFVFCINFCAACWLVITCQEICWCSC